MADLTTEFNTLLKGHEAPPARRPDHTSPDTATTDEFLKEAYRITSLVSQLHTELRKLRQAYLSTAAPRKSHLRTLSSRAGAGAPATSLTDRDREEIDANAKLTLRDLNARIRALDDAEQLRQGTETALLSKRFARGLGALGSWAAGAGALGMGKSSEQVAAEAAARQLGVHRESVIWYLRQRLQEAARTQQKMMETRLTREVEKNRSVLAKARGPVMAAMRNAESLGLRSPPVGGSSTLPGQEEGTRPPPSDVTAEQMQIFEKGNQDMLKHFESTLDKVRTAEKSLVEISELQNLLVNNLATQSAHIDQLVAESFETTEGVGKGNKELKKSASRASPARYTFLAATGLCAALVVWDLLI
ncbi:snare-complex protein syntaxin-18 N-terminus-domain-containing protein [Lasiosphaeris hirsuta]|uniref:Snare-complex protein syntaxin-18 N-terminus-domain-containing protein n=1 Tax=Lasiosphaeris hirsuta TaxID=260670 RepID=A0AA40APD1_9PEZI|nr:snare-complex protein syntaxin-18 N-terminus-domain-containing protein [Lasiosphaeris hirsuta]